MDLADETVTVDTGRPGETKSRAMLAGAGLVAVLLLVVGVVALLGSVEASSLAVTNSASTQSPTAPGSESLGQWRVAAAEAAKKSDQFRARALTAVKSQNYPVAAEALRSAGAFLIVIPESPDQGTCSGMLRSIGLSYTKAAVALERNDVDAAAAAIDEVVAGYARVTAQLESSGSAGLGQLA